MTIIDAIKDENLFGPFLGPELWSWAPWLTCLRAIYGLPIRTKEGRALVEQCTGKTVEELRAEGYKTALLVVGRRAGKSKAASAMGAYEAVFCGHEKRLACGETGLLPIISPTRYQSGIVWNYLRAIFEMPLLQSQIEEIRPSYPQTIRLRNRIEIVILTGDFKTVRGPALVCAIVDEACFFQLSDESRVKNDTELIRAIRPALLTTGGKLIAISSKYSRKGWAYRTWKRHYGSNKDDPGYVPNGNVLVWDAPSRLMNPTLSQEDIDAAYAEDPAAARSELGNEWRDEIQEFIPRAVVEALVVPGRMELMPHPRQDYAAFCDLSGGRHDDAALAIAHRAGKVILDCLRVWKAPFNPHAVVSEMAKELKRFFLNRVACDAFAGDFVTRGFSALGVRATKADLAKSELYREFLPVLCSGGIELLDNPLLVDQIAGLERATRAGGKDTIDHPRRGHDDLANVLAGVSFGLSKRKRIIGGFRSGGEIWRRV